MNRILRVGLLLIGIVLIAACSNESAGYATREVVSTLIVKAVNESGDPLCGADVYVDGQRKGKTHCYGSSIGTKTVVLSGTENLVKVSKEGYLTPEATTLPASEEGEQTITFTLLQQKAGFIITVEEKGEPVDNAEIQWFQGTAEQSIPLFVVHTNAQGQATMEEIVDGGYILKISKEGYETAIIEQEVALSSHNNRVMLAIELTKLPPLEIEVIGKGELLSDAEVAIYTKVEYNRPRAEPLHIKFTNQEGKVLFYDAKSEEPYVLVVKKEGFIAQVREIMVSSDEHSFQFDLGLE